MTQAPKVFLLAGFCISFGIYSSGIQEANNTIAKMDQQNSDYTQARMIATAGLNQANYYMAVPNWFNDNRYYNRVSVNNVSFGGSTFSYVIDKNGFGWDEARVTVNAKFNGSVAKISAIIKQLPAPTPYTSSWYNNRKDNWGNLYDNWEIKRIYYYPNQFVGE
jgi:hypothetical protein